MRTSMPWTFLNIPHKEHSLNDSQHILEHLLLIPMHLQPLNSTSSYRNTALLLFQDCLYGTCALCSHRVPLVKTQCNNHENGLIYLFAYNSTWLLVNICSVIQPITIDEHDHMSFTQFKTERQTKQSFKNRKHTLLNKVFIIYIDLLL